MHDDTVFRETDRRQINFDNMKYLNPETSANLYKIITKIHEQHLTLTNLTKPELNILFHGHIFTNSIDKDGKNIFNSEEMNIYSEILSECYARKYSDVEMFYYEYLKDLADDKKAEFSKKIDEFRNIQLKFEKILGYKDKL